MLGHNLPVSLLCAHPTEKGIAKAAEQLHQLRYLLLEAALPASTAPARQQLLLRVAEALLDGSTPAAAAPLLVGWLQEGLRRAKGGSQEAGQAQGGLSDRERVRCPGHAQRAVPSCPHGLQRLLRTSGCVVHHAGSDSLFAAASPCRHASSVTQLWNTAPAHPPAWPPLPLPGAAGPRGVRRRGRAAGRRAPGAAAGGGCGAAALAAAPRGGAG